MKNKTYYNNSLIIGFILVLVSLNVMLGNNPMFNKTLALVGMITTISLMYRKYLSQKK